MQCRRMEGETRGAPDFGSLLRHYRLSLGLSQSTLAERAGLSLYGISALERGYRRSPQRATLALLADALSLDRIQRQAFENAAVRPSLPRDRSQRSVSRSRRPKSGTVSLPLAVTSFVGRERELEQILALLREHQLVTVTGPGGVGKTQTALQAAMAESESVN
jgi:transcriptional regulator with XRE-family HTH domain